jgi:hypothetical protein
VRRVEVHRRKSIYSTYSGVRSVGNSIQGKGEGNWLQGLEPGIVAHERTIDQSGSCSPKQTTFTEVEVRESG